jgi:hypothetical protein
MGLSNAAKRARFYSSTINQNQGGGEKKAGFPYQIGRGWRTSIAFDNTNVVRGHCCTINSYQTMTFTSYARPSRPVGSDQRAYNIGIAQPIR